MIIGTLERFGGYTLETLLDEDPMLLQLMNIVAMGRPDPPVGDQ